MTKISHFERTALESIIKSEAHNGNNPVGNPVLSWSCNPFSSARMFRGVVSTLVKKKLCRCNGAGENARITLTQAGFDAVQP